MIIITIVIVHIIIIITMVELVVVILHDHHTKSITTNIKHPIIILKVHFNDFILIIKIKHTTVIIKFRLMVIMHQVVVKATYNNKMMMNQVLINNNENVPMIPRIWNMVIKRQEMKMDFIIDHLLIIIIVRQ